MSAWWRPDAIQELVDEVLDGHAEEDDHGSIPRHGGL